MKFNNRIAVITGGASGIGKATADILSKEGAQVLIADKNLKSAKKVAEELNPYSQFNLKAYKIDVVSRRQIDNYVTTVINEFKKIDILVHCAGLLDIKKINFLELQEEDWNKIINVNLNGTFLVCQRIMKEMVKKRYGRIITLGSLAGSIGSLVAGANYSASKAGIFGLTKAMAKFGASYNITANCVSPGIIETNMTKNWDDAIKKELAKSIPLKRFGKAEEVASAIAYLASSEASFITGITFNINGGLFMG
jgi:3-oxoacyl-[acyl-carrier protein] reductase